MTAKDCRYDVMAYDKIDEYIIEPMDDYVLVRVTLPKKETDSGLIVSKRENTDAGNKQIVGDIVSVGPKVDWTSVGDKIMFNQYSGTVALRKSATEESEGYELRLMAEKVLICKLRKKE